MLDRLVEIVIWWTLWGTAGIALARHRGGNFLTWFFVCGFTGPVGLGVGLLTLGARCPHCRSLINAEATVCPRCQKGATRKADKRGEGSSFGTSEQSSAGNCISSDRSRFDVIGDSGRTSADHQRHAMPRKCPQCGELIDADATDCEHCMEN